MVKNWFVGLTILVLMMATAEAGEWNLVRLTDNTFDDYFPVPGMSSDGSKMVFLSDSDDNSYSYWDREVYIMDLETLETTRVTNNIYRDYQAAVSSDGSSIAFMESIPVNDTDTIKKVYVVSKDDGWRQGDPLVTLTEDGAFIPFLSTSGEYLILFQRTGNDYDKIKTYRTVDGKLMGTYTLTYGLSGWPSQSPDKSKFVYVENVPYAGDPGKKRQRVHVALTSPPFTDTIVYQTASSTDVEEISSGLPAVSNDGKVVFYMESRHPAEGDVKKGVFIVDDGGIRLLTPTNGSVAVGISGDGSKVFYMERGKIYKINSDGSGKELVATISDVFGFGNLAVNDDGSRVVFLVWQASEDDYEIYMLSKEPAKAIPKIKIDLLPAFPSTTSVVVGSAKATHGDTVQIPVEIRSADKVGSMDIALAYPSQVLQFIDVIPGSLTQNSLLEHNVEDGRIRVGIVETNGISGDGSLFYMRFRVTGEPKQEDMGNVMGIDTGIVGRIYPDVTEYFGKSGYSLVLEELSVYDTDGSKINAIGINGTFSLVSEEEMNRGDVNGDGKITSVDALMALQMAVGKLEARSVADMDEDGKVTSKDAMEIMKVANQRMIEFAQKYMQQGGKIPSIGK
ncbi:MAG: hypothetical protein GXO67_06200 [Archaeoglobi archaeon]|nr:hypothetical protein [Archaeoglobi archaeon]